MNIIVSTNGADAPPSSPVPVPNAIIGTPDSAHKRTIDDTSWTLLGNTTTSGAACL